MRSDFLHKDFKWGERSFDTWTELIDFTNEKFPELNSFMSEWFGEEGEIRMKTSGSTGTPKTIVLRREHMVNSARATAAYFNLPSHSRALLCLPLGYVAGRMMLVRAMVMGWHLEVTAPGSRPEIPNTGVFDFAAMVPLQLYNSMDELASIDTLIVGGGEISKEIQERVYGLETKIFATYGMTETITHVAVAPVNRSAGRKGETLLFSALPDVLFSTDSRQCLVIEAPRVCSGQIVTNDVVQLISGHSFSWLGRFDNIINSGGLKLIPESIESKFKKVINKDFFAYGMPDNALGEQLVFVIEGKEQEGLYDKILDFKKHKPNDLSTYEVPKRIFFVKNFTRTETGKIKRKTTFQNALSR